MATETRTTNVDERVVQMTFNNAEFEKGVATTLSTLEKLKRSLNFKAKTTGMEDLGRAVGLVEKNLQPMANNLDHISNRFTALGIIGDQVIRNLTNRVTTFAEKMVKSATVEPLTSGFKEYETQMKSIQTILANTGMEGIKGVKKVNAALDELNAYADKTIYNFTQMTENIGRFTAAGVKLQPAVDAIKGTANLAAMSGSTAEQANRAMYNLSQALSTGTLKLIDWNSVVNANMGGQVFQQMLIRTAAAMDGYGDRIDEWKAKNVDAFGSFRDSLQKGWVTSDVLAEALHNFTYDVKEGTEEYEKALKELLSKGYTEEVAKDILKVATTATEAATKVRTFTQLIDTLKEALGSGWAQSWRLVFGDFLEATELWTGINNVLSEFIEQSSKARNEILTFWHDADEGGRAEFIDALKELVYDIALIVKPIKMAWDSVFGTFDFSTLQAITKAFKRFAESLHPSVEGFNSIYRIATSVFKIIKFGASVVGKVVSTVFKVGQPLLYLADAILVALGNILEAIDNNSAFTGFLNIIERIGNVLSYILVSGVTLLVNGISALATVIRTLRLPNFAEAFKQSGDAISGMAKKVPLLSSAIEVLKKITNGAKTGFEAFVRVIAAGLSAVVKVASYISNLPIITTAITGIKNILAALGGVITGIATTVINIFKAIGNINLNEMTNPLQFIHDLIISVVDAVVSGFKNIWFTIESRLPIFKTFRTMVVSVITAFKNGLGTIKEFFDEMRANDVDFNGAKAGIDMLVQGFKDLTAIITPGKLAAIGFTTVMLAMALTFIKVGNLFAQTIKIVNNTFNTVNSAIKGFVNVQANRLIQAAESLLMVAAAIAIVAGIPKDELDRAMDAILKLTGLMGAIVVAIEFFKSQKHTLNISNSNETVVNLGGVALMILEIGASLYVIAKTLQEFEKFDIEAIKNNFGSVIVAFSAIIVTIIALDKLKVSATKGAGAILVISGALYILMSSLKQLEGIGAIKTEKALKGLIGVMGALTALSFAAKGIGLTTGIGLFITANALEKLIPQISRLYEQLKAAIPWSEVMTFIENYKEGFVALSATVAGITVIAGILGKGLSAFGVVIAAIAGAIYVITMAIDNLTQIAKENTFNQAVTVMAGIGVFVGAWLFLAKMIPEKSAILKTGVAIAIMASSLLIINLAIAQMSEMLADNTGTILLATGLVTGMMALIGWIMKVSQKAANVKGAMGIIMSMMIGLTIMIGEIIALSFMDPGELLAPLGVVTVLMLLMGNILRSIKGVTAYNMKALAAMAGAVIAIWSIIASLYTLSQMDPRSVLAAGTSMALIIGMLAMMYNTIMKTDIGSTGRVDAMFVGLAAMAVEMWAIGWTLSQLAVFDADKLLNAGVAVSAVLAVTTILFKLVSTVASEGATISSGIGTLFYLGSAIGALAGVCFALKWLSEEIKDPSQLLNYSISVSAMLLGLAAVVAVFGKLGAIGIKGAAIAVLSIFTFVGGLVALFAGLAGLIKAMKDEWNIDVFGLLGDFADGLGTVIGKFASAVFTNATKGLEEVGTTLSNFAQNASTFFEASKGIDVNATTGIKNLAEALLAIGAGGLFDAIAQLIVGESQIAKMETILPKLAKGLVAYNDVVNAVDESGEKVHDFTGIDNSTEALKKIVDLCKAIPNAGGAIDAVFGSNDAGDFGGDLGALAQGLVDYVTKVNEIKDFGNFDKSTAALEKLNAVAKNIPNMGGKIAEIFGDNEIDVFGSKLSTLGMGLYLYASWVDNVKDWGPVFRSADALVALDEAAKAVPNMGGVIAGIFGDKKLDEFGSQLAGLATNLVTYSHDIATVDTPAMNRCSKALKNFLESTAGFIELNMGNIGTKIGEVSEAVIVMADTLADAFTDYDNEIIKSLVGLIEAAIEQAKKEKNADFRKLGVGFGDSMGDGIKAKYKYLGEQIKSLVKNAIEYANKELEEVSYEAGAKVGDQYVKGYVGPEGIDPGEDPSPSDPSDRILNNTVNLVGNGLMEAGKNLLGVAKDSASKIGSVFSDTVVNGFSLDGLIDAGNSFFSTIEDIASGRITAGDALHEAGSAIWEKLGFQKIFPEFNELLEGSDIERDITKGLGSIAEEASKKTGSLGSALKSTTDKLKTYTKYLKYSTLVEEEFAKTTGSAMSLFTNAKPIDNAKVAVAALAEQIYADSKKVRDAVESDSDNAADAVKDRALAVMEAFNEDYEALMNSVSGAADMFKNFYSEAANATKPVEALRNMQSQLDGYTQLVQKYQILAVRGVPSDYLQELGEKGAEARSEVNSLLAMSDDDLQKYLKIRGEANEFKETIAAQLMSAKATSIAVEKLREEAKGYKAVDKNLKNTYKTYTKLAKEIFDKGGDPFQDAEVVQLFEKVKQLCVETNTSMKDLDDTMVDSAAANAAAALEIIDSYTKANTVIDKYNTTFAETEQSVRQLIEDQLGGFETFTKKTGISADDMIDILTSQARGVRQWSKELATLGSRGLSQEILQDLEKLGPEGYEKVHAFYKMSASQIQQANTLWAQRGSGIDQASRIVATSFAGAAAGGIEAYKQALDEAADNKEQFESIIEKFTTNVTDEITAQTSAQIIAGGRDLGRELVDEMAASAEENKSKAGEAGKDVAKEATDKAAETITEETEKTVEPAVDSGINSAAKSAADEIISSNDEHVLPAVETAAEKAANKWTETYEKTIKEDMNLLDNKLANGLPVKKTTQNTIPTPSKLTSITDGINEAKDPFKKQSGRTYRLNGLSNMDNYVAGLTDSAEASVSKVRASGAKVGAAVDEGARSKKGTDEHSPSKKGEENGFFYAMGVAIGLDKGVKDAKKNAAQSALAVTNVFKEAAAGISDIFSGSKHTRIDMDKNKVRETAKQNAMIDDLSKTYAKSIHLKDDGTLLTDEEKAKRIKSLVTDYEDPGYMRGVYTSIPLDVLASKTAKEIAEMYNKDSLEEAIRKADTEDSKKIADGIIGALTSNKDLMNEFDIGSLMADQVSVYSLEQLRDIMLENAQREYDAAYQWTHSQSMAQAAYNDYLNNDIYRGVHIDEDLIRSMQYIANLPSTNDTLNDSLSQKTQQAEAAVERARASIEALSNVSIDSAIAVTDAIRNAAERANALEQGDALRPSVSPVVNWNDVQNGFSVLGNLANNRQLFTGYQPTVAQMEIANHQAATLAAMQANRYDDSKLINEVAGLRNDVNTLNDKMGNLQVVMDSGPLVGAIAPKMDTELGTIYRRRNRG